MGVSKPIWYAHFLTTSSKKMIQLTKQSSNNEIQLYFEKVRALRLSKEEFPVNFDEVWPLVYNRRNNAKRELTSKFIDGIDYYFVQNSSIVRANKIRNGIAYEAYLSVPCLEWFLVKKDKRLFEIYKKVFYNKYNSLSELEKTDIKLREATWIINVLRYNDEQKLQLARQILTSDIPIPKDISTLRMYQNKVFDE